MSSCDTSINPCSCKTVQLRLTGLSFDRIEFEADCPDATCRPVTVVVGSGVNWRRAVIFPHGRSETGVTLGSDEADQQVLDRAVEELVRLEASVAALRERVA